MKPFAENRVTNLDAVYGNNAIMEGGTRDFFIFNGHSVGEHPDGKRCTICGRRAMFGTILRCHICGNDICHRHEKEQFVRYEMPNIYEEMHWEVFYNYPNGEPLKRNSFKCYRCRTGNKPTDLGERKLDLIDYSKYYVWLSIILIFGLSFLSYNGLTFGLSHEVVQILIYLTVIYTLILILFVLFVGIYWFRKNKKILKST